MSGIIFVFGTIFGSFLGVVIDRLPAKRNIATGRSMCDNCHVLLGPLDLIPIFSFLRTKGRCAHCGTQLSLRYPLLEVLTGLAYMLCYMVFGLSFNFYIGLVLSSLLIVTAFIDIDTMFIYDRFHVLILLLGLVSVVYNPSLLRSGLLGMVIVSLPYLILAILTQGIGGGDVKLIAASGLLLGAPNTVLAFIISTLIGGVYAVYVLLSKKQDAKSAIPYGPFLCIGIFVAFLYGPNIIHSYLSLFF